MTIKQIARIMRRQSSCYISAKMLQDGITISWNIYPVLLKLGFSLIRDNILSNGSIIVRISHNLVKFQEENNVR